MKEVVTTPSHVQSLSMKGVNRYQEQLEKALETRRQWLEAEQLPRLKDALASFLALFEGAMGMLIRKGLLREDPYNYEQAFTEITIPKDDTLPEFENSDEVSYRLAAYRRQLKFVSTDYPLILSNLTLARLKKLSSLVTYINWLELGESSKSPTTRAFARVFIKVRMDADAMSSKILKDSEVQIIKAMHLIRSLLADVAVYLRESWKAEVRRSVLPTLTLGASAGRAREEMLRGVRRGFPVRMPGKPWYPSLVEDMADEELAEDGEQRRAAVLASLAVPIHQKPGVTQAPDGRAILLEAVRILSRPGGDLAAAISVLEENERLIQKTRDSRSGWLKRLLGSDSRPRNGERVYKVQYSEPGVPTPKTETIDFPQFAAEVQKKSSLLEALVSGTGPAFRRLAATREAQLAGFVDKQLNELMLIHRRMTCLNTMLQVRAMREKKAARGIKVELLTIKNAIVKANHSRHDYKEKHAC